jgi:uncharacterized protein
MFMQISEPRSLLLALAMASLCVAPALALDQKDGAGQMLLAPQVMPQAVLPQGSQAQGQQVQGLTTQERLPEELVVPAPSQPAARALVPTQPGFTSVTQALRVGVDRYKSGDKAAAAEALGYAANEGSATARFKLGQMYAVGDGVPHDDFQAFQFFRQITVENADEAPDSAAARVVSRAFIQVGKYYLDGIPNSDVTPDINEAYRNFHYAAAYFGDADAQYNIARLHLDGALGEKDAMQAARWLKLAADKKHKAARGLLGHMLFFGNGIQRQPSSGLAWLMLANKAAQGETDNWIRDSFRAADEAASPEIRVTAEKLAAQITER